MLLKFVSSFHKWVFPVIIKLNFGLQQQRPQNSYLSLSQIDIDYDKKYISLFCYQLRR